MKTVGFIGLGNMGMAIAKGMVSGGLCRPEEILVYDKSGEAVLRAQSEGFLPAASEAALYDAAEIFIFAVKPQNFSELLTVLKSSAAMDQNKLHITIAAGVTIRRIQDALGKDAKVVRVMPNTPLLIGKGASVLARSANVTDEEFKLAREIFSAMGSVETLPEDKIDAVTAVNGSSPAYFYLFIEAMVEAAAEMGIPADAALSLAAHSMAGAADMVLKGEFSPSRLRENVSSPGGSTLAALSVFEKEDFKGMVRRAMAACRDRNIELGK